MIKKLAKAEANKLESGVDAVYMYMVHKTVSLRWVCCLRPTDNLKG